MHVVIDHATIARVSAAIDGADLGHSIRLVRLVDGISTYTCRIGSEPKVREFSSYDDASAYVAARKRWLQAVAVISALTGIEPEILMAPPHDTMADADGDDGA